MQGMGVSTPSAAAVAAATVGLARLVHMPKGGMLAPGIMSVMAAAGLPSTSTRASGRTTRVDGAMPKLHCSIAVAVAAGLPISSPRRPLDRLRQLRAVRRGDEAERRA